jgi:hypothetical protein
MELIDLVTAGVDINGKDYNTGDWIVPGWGGGLVLDSDLSNRVCQIRYGLVTKGVKNPASYSRPMTRRTFTVPFEVSGEIFLISRMDDTFIIGENRKPTWNWSPNFHPVFVDEDNNVVTGLSEKNNQWSASGQINKEYGIPFIERYRAKMNHDDQIGAWHKWRMVVPEIGTHEVYWDNVLVYKVVEKNPPAEWWNRPLHVALRLDFYDYKLKFDPFQEYQPSKGRNVNLVLFPDPSSKDRIIDTRKLGAHPKPGVNNTWTVNHLSIPLDATAMLVNLHAVDPVSPGWLSAWGSGDWPKTTSILYDTNSASNQITVLLDAGKFRTRSLTPVHFVMDAVGYYKDIV